MKFNPFLLHSKFPFFNLLYSKFPFAISEHMILTKFSINPKDVYELHCCRLSPHFTNFTNLCQRTNKFLSTPFDLIALCGKKTLFFNIILVWVFSSFLQLNWPFKKHTHTHFHKNIIIIRNKNPD